MDDDLITTENLPPEETMSTPDRTAKEVRIALESSQKNMISSEKNIGDQPERPDGPVGLDVGTSTIVFAENRGGDVKLVSQRNAFFTVPFSNFTRDLLISKEEIPFVEMNGQFYILGKAAEDFAGIFHANTRRPMQQGLLSSNEGDAIPIIQSILKTLLLKPKMPGETIYFSIPGQPIEGENTVVYHTSVIRAFLSSLGYTPVPINEALAVIFAELPEEEFTGIAVSMGGGMCNICLAYLSVPIITFSIQKGGDYIDRMAGNSVGEPATSVKLVKENELNLSARPKNRMESALHIFYGDLTNMLLDSIQSQLMATDRMPKISQPLPIVLTGGTSIPEGYLEMFTAALKNVTLPVEISDVRTSVDPLTSVARGALVKALSDESG